LRHFKFGIERRLVLQFRRWRQKAMLEAGQAEVALLYFRAKMARGLLF
jgi:hypothetical protein